MSSVLNEFLCRSRTAGLLGQLSPEQLEQQLEQEEPFRGMLVIAALVLTGLLVALLPRERRSWLRGPLLLVGTHNRSLIPIRRCRRAYPRHTP